MALRSAARNAVWSPTVSAIAMAPVASGSWLRMRCAMAARVAWIRSAIAMPTPPKRVSSGSFENLQAAIAEPGRAADRRRRPGGGSRRRPAPPARPARCRRGDAADLLPDAQLRLRDHGLDPDARRRRLARQVLDVDLAQRDALAGGQQLDLVDRRRRTRRARSAPAACGPSNCAVRIWPARKPAATAASRMPRGQQRDRARAAASRPGQPPRARRRRPRSAARSARRNRRRRRCRTRPPARPATAGAARRTGSRSTALRSGSLRPHAIAVSDRSADCQLPRARPMAKNPAAPAHRSGANTIGSRSHDRRHPLCPLAHRLPAYRRRPHGPVQLALCPPSRRHLPAAHRGHRPRSAPPRKRSRPSSTA